MELAKYARRREFVRSTTVIVLCFFSFADGNARVFILFLELSKNLSQPTYETWEKFTNFGTAVNAIRRNFTVQEIFFVCPI